MVAELEARAAEGATLWAKEKAEKEARLGK